ncbi:MAG: extracellular solute-binding protein [Planctomycetes bacterium]|nr:extracellular solute-binding protein [Planctomycetota bacterium]
MKAVAAIAAIVLLLVAPILLRPARDNDLQAQRLVIITPHGEPTRYEFGRAFTRWAARELGTQVDFDWRTPGGTGDITRFIESSFKGRFAQSDPHSADPAAFDATVDPDDFAQPEYKRAARRAFLASDVGIGIDLWWGGGEFPHRKFAERGYSVDAGLVRDEPAWFTDSVIPQELSGETIFDKKGRYYATCLTTFGICWSVDRLALLQPAHAPTGWSDLGEPRFFDQITMVDPTRSGAIVSALERLIQERMTIASAPGDTAETRAQGWATGFALIKRIAANARALTEGASQAVREVARGDTAAAMCIDFHARTEAEYSARQSQGIERLRFVMPVGGTSVSGDPIALLRGAPNRTLATAFIRFVLSQEGQRLYDYRVGEPGGPERYALRRLPVRRDVYTPLDRSRMSDPEGDPFLVAASFNYRRDWTGRLYDLIGPLTKAVILDPRDELVSAWRAIIDAGGAERVPEAWREFAWMPFPYGEAQATLTQLQKDPVSALSLTRGWTVDARAHYRAAERLAREGR